MHGTRRKRGRQLRVGASVLAVVGLAGAIAACAVAAPTAPGGTRHGVVQPRASATGPMPARPVTSGGAGGVVTGRRIVTPEPVASAGQARAARGTVLSGCSAEASQEGLGRDWQASPATTHAGPLYFVDGGHSRGPLRLYVAVAVLSGLPPGSVVVVKVAPAGRSQLRFLYGPADSLSPGARHTMASGESGVTFVACAGGGTSADLTDYYGGFLIRGAHCVPARAWVPGRTRPVTFRLGAC